MGGVSAYHIRMLMENPWNGGGGYTPEQVGKMTLDQIWFCLCDIKYLKREVGHRSEKVSSMAASATLKVDDRGRAIGKTADDKTFRARIGGKSLARELMERKAKREATEKSKSTKRRGT